MQFMHSEDLTLSDSANPPVRHGWISVMTPMGASAQVVINSASWDACTEWQLLNSGRGLLSPTNAFDWFSEEELSRLPSGLVAELAAASDCMDQFTKIIAEDPVARRHILRVPESLFGADSEEWSLVSKCVDIARVFEARAHATDAVREALRDRDD